VPADFEMEKLSPLGQEIAQLDEVDRNIIQELGHKFANMIERTTNAAKAERLAANRSEANGRVGAEYRLRSEQGMTNTATNPSKTPEGQEEKPNQPSRFIIAMIPVKKKPLPPSPTK